MALLGKLKDFFLPSPEVGAARRKDVFGTESKAVAGGLIVAGAGAAIVAPVAIGAAGLRGAVGAAGRAFAGASLPTKALVVLGAPVAAGAVLNEPKIVPRTAGGLVNLQANLFEAGKDPSFEKVKDIFQENPVLATGLAAIGAGGITAGTVGAVNALRDFKEQSPAYIDAVAGAPASFLALPEEGTTKGTSPAPDQPITRETQVLGREPSRSVVGSRRKSRSKPAETTVRVNILNQNAYIEA